MASSFDHLPSLTLIRPEDIRRVKKIGQGLQGAVYQAKIGNTDVAVKTLSRDFDEEAWLNLQNEIRILSHLSHPNICLFQGASLEPNQLTIVSELCVRDLEKHIPIINSLIQRIDIAREICCGMSWLHENCGIVHMDLKPANILIDNTVTDFGYSRILDPNKLSSQFTQPLSYGGTPWYTAPERWKMYLSRNFESDQPASDIYSFGIILWNLITKESNPYPNFTDQTPQEEFISQIIQGTRPSLKNISPDLKMILNQVWHDKCQQRPTFSQIQKMLDNAILNLTLPEVSDQNFWMMACSFSNEDREVETDRLKISISRTHFVSSLKKIIIQHLSSIKGSSYYTSEFLCGSIPDINTVLLPEVTIKNLNLGTDKAIAKFSKNGQKEKEAADKEFIRRIWIGKIYTMEKMLLSEDGKTVSLEHFSKIISTLRCHILDFSPFGLIETVYGLCQKTWFHPLIDSQAASKLLENNPGKFLVRMRMNEPQFTLTQIQSNHKTFNTLFKYSESTHMWEYANLSRPTLVSLVDDIESHHSSLKPFQNKSPQFYNPVEVWNRITGPQAYSNYSYDIAESSSSLKSSSSTYGTPSSQRPDPNNLESYVIRAEKMVELNNPKEVNHRIHSLNELKRDLIKQLITNPQMERSQFMHTLGEYTLEIELLTYHLAKKNNLETSPKAFTKEKTRDQQLEKLTLNSNNNNNNNTQSTLPASQGLNQGDKSPSPPKRTQLNPRDKPPSPSKRIQINLTGKPPSPNTERKVRSTGLGGFLKSLK